jgi:hypothetical protein
MFALFLFLLLAFMAVGLEAGRWYVVRAELSKSVDAGALQAAKNLSNPFVSPRTIGLEMAQENFPGGYMGTPGSGAGSASFVVDAIGNSKIKVTGNVNSIPFLAQILGITVIPTTSVGVAQKKEVEIMLVLDRSGSMSGQPISDLMRAAKLFVSFFSSTQDKDKMGLISFATSVTVNRPLGVNYVSPMTTAINGLNADGATNPEDALIQAIGPLGFTDQTGVPGDQRIQQFLIFFSDGRPTAFRGSFLNNNTPYDGVGCVTGNCEVDHNGNPDGGAYNLLGKPSVEAFYPTSLRPNSTGNGIAKANCGNGNGNVYTTRWYAFDASPVPGYAATAECILDRPLHDQICSLASGMALGNASTIKNRRITIYTIGLGGYVNSTFMRALASGPTLYYNAPTSGQLQALFQQVAQEIKLRLVQ